MTQDTCYSQIRFQGDSNDNEPFRNERLQKASEMHAAGKSSKLENWGPIEFKDGDAIGKRSWQNHEAAQEFIDWVVANAVKYNITIIESKIADFE